MENMLWRLLYNYICIYISFFMDAYPGFHGRAFLWPDFLLPVLSAAMHFTKRSHSSKGECHGVL